MTVDRRTFLKGIGALGALAFVPASVTRALAWSSRPILYGDGVHDDGPALNALFAGEDVDVRDSVTRVLEDGTVFIAHGTYRLTDRIYIPLGRPDISIQSSVFAWEQA